MNKYSTIEEMAGKAISGEFVAVVVNGGKWELFASSDSQATGQMVGALIHGAKENKEFLRGVAFGVIDEAPPQTVWK